MAGKRLQKSIRRPVLWELPVLFLGANVLTGIYILTSQTVYVWDNAGYWMMARMLAEQPFGWEQAAEVMKSTAGMDYNLLLAWPVSFLMRLFGGSREVFLFSITNLYTLPGLWGLTTLARRRGGGGLTLVGLLPIYLYTGMVGFVDVAAAALAIWAYVCYTGERPAVFRGTVTGLLLVGTFLLRRYFFFFAASFGVAAVTDKLFFDRRNWKDFIVLFITTALTSLVFAFRFLVEKVLGGGYGELYSAYRLGLWSDLLLLCRYFGGGVLLLLLVVGVRACLGERRRQAVFPMVQMGVCFLAFVMVQSHGQHHLLLYLPGLAVLMCLWTPPRGWKPVMAAVLMIWCLIPNEQPGSVDEIGRPTLLSSFDFYGPKREDIGELMALEEYVNGLSSEEPRTAVVLASSFTLNSETLTNLRPSLNLAEPERRTVIQYHGAVDKRDGFNWNSLTADYLIIGDPVQTHLGEENQQVVTIFAEEVLSGEGIGTAYTPLDRTFRLENECTVRIYERNRNLTGEEYRSISRRLTQSYPAYADLYTVPDWIK